MTRQECGHWEQVSSAVDGELPEPVRTEALDHAHRCGFCGPLLAGLDSLEVHVEGLPARLGSPVLDPEQLSGRERRWLHGRWTRWFLGAAALIIVAEAVPAFVTGHGHGLDAQTHAARHLATWQIGFGVGLLVAALMSRLTHAMLALAATFATLTVTATIIDIINGHRGPWAESVHVVELVGVVLLWQLTPPHLLPWRTDSKPEQTAQPESQPDQPLRLVPPDEPDHL